MKTLREGLSGHDSPLLEGGEMKAPWPTLEFRPLPDDFSGAFRRFAQGKWILDDGEYDLAFIGTSSCGAPICLYVALPYQRNIVLSWLTTHWASKVKEHSLNGNAWHYALRPRETEWGGDWGRANSENSRAGDAGMNKLSGEVGCCSGQHVEMNPGDLHFLQGLVREQRSKRVFLFEPTLACYECGISAFPTSMLSESKGRG